jgi:hypothetical protein
MAQIIVVYHNGAHQIYHSTPLSSFIDVRQFWEDSSPFYTVKIRLCPKNQILTSYRGHLIFHFDGRLEQFSNAIVQEYQPGHLATLLKSYN